MKKYSELKKLKTFEERFEYLQLNGKVGVDTFAFDRYLNQEFYKSKEWQKAKREVIIRDKGCDLGIEGFDINGRHLVHHMNPISQEQILNRDSKIFDPEYLILVSHSTHNAIHYGTEPIKKEPVERKPGDTKLW